jgi:hypothetical protein
MIFVSRQYNATRKETQRTHKQSKKKERKEEISHNPESKQSSNRIIGRKCVDG